MISKKNQIESKFFEFWKMKAFLEIGVGISVGKYQFAPIDVVSRYVNSQLLIDLFPVFELSVQEIFLINNLKLPEKKKYNLDVLNNNKLLINKPYVNWYIDWRNEVAHEGRKVEWSELNQAFEDIKEQLISWKLLRDFDIKRHYATEFPNVYKVGSRIKEIPILEYRVEFTNQPCGICPSWTKTIDLNLNDYLRSN
jgi:hypothetical protein